MQNTLHLYNHDRVQVAAHRGTAGGNIPCNSLAAFEIALRGGASILEMDLFQSRDGEIFIFHTGKEPFQIDRHIDITKLTSEEIRTLRLVNVDCTETELGLNSFDEVLETMKGRCILNLDRCCGFLPAVIRQVEHHGMREQILLKNAPTREILDTVEEVAPEYMFMPIYRETDTATAELERRNIHYMGAELVFSTEKAPIVQPEYIEAMHQKGRILWGNAILYDYKEPLSAGHTDDVSLTQSPAQGWGWLVDHGFDIIQTDWAWQCCQYLRESGVKR